MSEKTRKYPSVITGLITLFIILHPLIDVVTCINSRTGIGFSVGVVLRSLFIVAAAFHVMFIYRGRFRKFAVGYIILLGIYCAVYFVNIYMNSDLSVVLANLRESIKTVYFPIAAVLLFSLYDQYGFTVKDNILAFVGVLFSGIISIADIFGVGYPSYDYGKGTIGFFYSANEISAILVVLVPCVFMWLCRYVRESRRPAIAAAISATVMFMCAYAGAFVGTKVAYFGIVAYVLCCIGWSLIKMIGKKDRVKHRSMAVMSVSFAAILLSLYFISPIYYNLSNHIDNNYQSMAVEGVDKDDSQPIYFKDALEESTDNEEELAAEMNRMENDYKEYRAAITATSMYRWVNWVTSNRFNYLIPIHYSFIKAPALTRVIGLGYRNTNVCEFNIEKSVELDAFSVLYRHGVGGLIIIMLPLIICAVYVLWTLISNIKRAVNAFDWCSLLFALIMGFGVGFITGHTLVAPAVSIYIAVVMVSLTATCRRINDEKAASRNSKTEKTL